MIKYLVQESLCFQSSDSGSPQPSCYHNAKQHAMLDVWALPMEYGRKEGQVIFVAAVLSLVFTICCKKERDSSLSHKARMSKEIWPGLKKNTETHGLSEAWFQAHDDVLS